MEYLNDTNILICLYTTKIIIYIRSMSLKKSNIFIIDISSIILYNFLDNIPIVNQTDSNYRIDPEIFHPITI